MSSNLTTDNRTPYAAAMWLACVILAGTAYASEPFRTETVKFSDLNLSSQAGAEVLYSRIHAAARRVCEQPSGWMLTAATPCMKKAESEAIAKVNAPLLTGYYEKRTGNHAATLIANR